MIYVYEFYRSINDVETAQKICNVYREATVKESIVRFSCQYFGSKNFDLHNKSRRRSQNLVENEELKVFLEIDLSLITHLKQIEKYKTSKNGYRVNKDVVHQQTLNTYAQNLFPFYLHTGIGKQSKF